MQRNYAFYMLLVSCAVAGIVGAIALYPAVSWADKDEDEDDEVEELMEKTHEGKKSPWKKAERAAKQDPIDWAAINISLPRLEAMSKALTTTKNKEVKDAADGYVHAVKDLAIQAKKKDVAGTRAAIMSLANSCADCHHKGGPGGKLED
jgi:cytochrome c553